MELSRREFVQLTGAVAGASVWRPREREIKTISKQPGSPGFLALSGAPLVQPFVLFGMELWIDPGYPVFLALGTVSDNTGLASVPLPLPPDPGLTGAQLYAQFLWPDSCAPGSLAASQALAVTVQP